MKVILAVKTLLPIVFSLLLAGCEGEFGSDLGSGSDDYIAYGDTLQWRAPTENTDGTPLTDLTGYIIYFGSSSDSLTHSITLDNPDVSTYSVADLANVVTLQPGNIYYFGIIAINSRNLGSNLSNVVALRY